MYKLLLVSDKAEIRALYAQYAGWETLGFERPAIAATAQEGIDLLAQGGIDAVSWLLSLGEGKQFFAYISKRPEMLGVETARDEARLRRELGSARRALNERDMQAQAGRADDMLRAMSRDFFSGLLMGTPYGAARIDERLLALGMDAQTASRPVVMASFRLPQGDYFLSEVWRYGRERLENALRNIFENSDGRLFSILLVINPHHLRLLCLPLEPMDEGEVYAATLAHIDRCQSLLDTYFELSLTVKRVVPYQSLYAFDQENALRTAH